jgi:hypothetical protein
LLDHVYGIDMARLHATAIGNVSRSWVALLVTGCGALALVAPGVAISVLNLVPGIDIVRTLNSNVTGVVRVVGAGYVVAGVLGTLRIVTGSPNHLSRVVSIALACAAGVFVARFVWLPGSDIAVIVSFIGMFAPLIVGSTHSLEGVAVSGVFVITLIGAGTVLHTPSSATLTPSWFTVALTTALSIAWGIPLYGVGWQWRRQAPASS